MPALTSHPLAKHVLAIFIFAAVALMYFYPATFMGKVIGNQTDRIQSIARKHEVETFRKQEGRPILWTNSIFSGMPSTLVGGSEPNTYDFATRGTLSLFRFFTKSTTPYALFFGGFLGMYLLLMVCRVDWRLSVLGAILYGLSTSHLLVLEGGHFNKLQNLILCPPFFAGILLLFRGKVWTGFTLSALFGGVILLSAHIQIAYYFIFLLIAFVAIRGYQEFKVGALNRFGRHLGLLVLAGVLALLPNLFKMWSLKSYGDESIRGKSELVLEDQPSEGLTKDYAFSWSMGKLESMSILVPDVMGATSGSAFVENSESNSYQALLTNPRANQLAQFTVKYWGDQPFVGGAYYYGAIMLMIFFIALFVIPTAWRWWSVISMVIIFAIGWGRNLEWFNFFLFDNLPLFNKFRAVNMIFNLGHIVVVAVGIMGLNHLLKMEKKEALKAVYKGAGITLGFAALVILFSFTMDLASPNDQIIKSEKAFVEALKMDRADLMRADAFRTILWILAGALILWLWTREKLSTSLVIFLLPVMALVDIVSVNLRYVNDDSYVKPSNFKRIFEARKVDKDILKDKDLHYRVFDMSNGDPFNNNLASYHHRLVGGYHPAKLKRFQEVRERYLEDPVKYDHLFNMLNTKYFIGKTGQGQVLYEENKDALGNAWFVERIETVENANQEIKKIKDFDPSTTAIMQEKWAEDISSKDFGPPSGSNVKLVNYIPDHLTYEYTSDKERLLVFSELYYPESKGWKIYVDGKRKEGLKKANYLLNATMVPAGSHTLELRFEPDNWYSVLWVSRIGGILITLLVLYMLYLLLGKGDFTWAETESLSTFKGEKAAA